MEGNYSAAIFANAFIMESLVIRHRELMTL